MNNQENSLPNQLVTLFQQFNKQDSNIGLGAFFKNIIYIPGNQDHHFDSQPPTQREQTFFDILKAHVKANDVQDDPTTPSTKYHSIETLEMERGLLEHCLAQTKADFLKDGDETRC